MRFKYWLQITLLTHPIFQRQYPWAKGLTSGVLGKQFSPRAEEFLIGTNMSRSQTQVD
jgi:hypothetical protein